MEKPTGCAREIAASIQALYRGAFDDAILSGKQLIETLPARTPPIAHRIFFSTVERVFILVQDCASSFLRDLEGGYFTTASLARGLMEAAATLALLSRDKKGEIFKAYLVQQELFARKRHDELLKLQTAADPKLAEYAKTEIQISGRTLKTLEQVRAHAELPPSSKNFPDMAARCRALGKNWEFLYHAVYRDLCEAVHGSFFKTSLTPGIALNSPNQGEGLVFEHCRTFGYAFEFWAYAMVECCQSHPNKEAVGKFCQQLSKLIDADARLINSFPPSSRRHQIVF